MPPDNLIRQAELLAQGPHFVLEQFTQGLDQLQLHSGRQSPDVVVRFDRRRGALEAHAFDDIGIQRALHEVFDAFQLFGLDLKILNEETADNLSLPLGVGHALQAREKLTGAIEDPHVQMHLRREGFLDLVTFTGTQHPVVDENAGQLIADRTVRERGRHRGIHPAAQGADHPLRPDLLPDLFNGRVDIGAHGPGRLAAADIVNEVLEDRGALGGVRHFRMKLKTVDALPGVVPLHRGDGRIVRVCDGAESWRHPFDAIPVRHPHDGRAPSPYSLEQIRPVIEGQLSPAKLAVRSLLHFAALQMRHQLHSVANPENGNALFEELFGYRRSLFVVHARWSAG